MNKMKVSLDKKISRSYDIHIGREMMDRVGLVLMKNNWAAHYIIVTDSNVEALHGHKVVEALRATGLQVDMVAIQPGESSKTMETGLHLVERLMELGTDRTSAIIALGGGVVGDLAGFIASIYMRGIPLVHIPTTLLAQVDSSIGGKTGIDPTAGKNIIGTFYQPRAVFIDLAFLETLSPREFGNGLAEILKYGAIDDPDILNSLEGGPEAFRRDRNLVERIVTKACRIKKGIVEFDETEQGLRRILNFGHTVGHAVEAESGYRVSHGEAVAIGMAAATLISEQLKHLPRRDHERLTSLIRAMGLPDRILPDLSSEGILMRMKRDKKKKGAVVHFVLLKKLGIPFVNGGVPEDLIRKVIKEMQQ